MRAAAFGALVLLLVPGTTASELSRSASHTYGAIQTDRSLLNEEGEGSLRRGLLDGPEGGRLQTWVIGLDPARAEHIRALCKKHGARLQAPLPGEHTHWLISASRRGVMKLMVEDPSITQAVLPDVYKLAPGLRAAIELPKSGSTSSADVFSGLSTYDKEVGCARVRMLALVHASSLAEVQRLCQQVTQRLKAHARYVASRPVSTTPLTEAIQIKLCTQDAVWAASTIAGEADVLWVDLVAAKVTANLNAGAIQQAPDKMRQAPSGQLASGSKGPYFPYWKAGLDGRGEVVGMIDTGVDMDSCFFWDPAFKEYRSGPNVVTLPKGVKAFKSDTHRKVALYVFNDESLDEEGHGTFCGASILGSAYGYDGATSPDMATGVVPAARIAVLDVSSIEKPDLDIPDDPNQALEHIYQAGARIVSNSWTFSRQPKEWSTNHWSCRLYDSYLYKNQDVLLAFATGNFGADTSYLSTSGTVAPPAVCKNTLAVGAAENWLQKGLPGLSAKLVAQKGARLRTVFTSGMQGLWTQGTITFQHSGGSYILRSHEREFSLLEGMDSRMLPLAKKSFQVVLANPADACQGLSNASITASTVVLLRQTKQSGKARCSLEYSAQQVSFTQAAGVFMYLEDVSYLERDNINGLIIRKGTFPIAIITKKAGVFLEGILKSGGSLSVTWSAEGSQSEPAPFENVAAFSGYASSKGGLHVKPDLLAPGLVWSAKSDQWYSGTMDQCEVMSEMGTSMANAVLTGAAVIVRQYFMKGFYPTGRPSSSSQFTPSGTLIKGVLIAGAAAMTGKSSANNAPLKPPPSAFQGFGRADLSGSLPLDGDSKGWGMQVLDQVSFNDTTPIPHTYKISVDPKAGRPLSVALVYADWPATPGAASILVNNLDLTVTGPAGDSGSAVFWGNGITGGDKVNNVEKVYLASPQPGEYTITVSAFTLFIDSLPQTYSLVVLGAVTSTIDSPFNPAK